MGVKLYRTLSIKVEISHCLNKTEAFNLVGFAEAAQTSFLNHLLL